MAINIYMDLNVWQKSMDLVLRIYEITKTFPQEEKFALSNQMRRAVVSIPSNNAEGQQRKPIKEYINFLSIAKGSNAEIQTQLLICKMLKYSNNKEIDEAFELSNEIGKMLNGLIISLTPST